MSVDLKEESWEELRKEWDYLQNGGLEKIKKRKLLEECRKVNHELGRPGY